MAIFDWSMQTIQRSAGRSAVAAAAYRSGMRLRDERTGLVHDFSRRRGIYSEIIMPAGLSIPIPEKVVSSAATRSSLWNAAEKAERRCNSVVAREIVIAIPHELPAPLRSRIIRGYASYLATRFGVVADIAIHPPARRGDRRNWHAHVLISTRRVGPGFVFGEKTRELDAAKTGGPIIADLRKQWAALANLILIESGSPAVIDHRSLADRGITRLPDRHIGPKATTLARKLRARAGVLQAEIEALELAEAEPARAEVPTASRSPIPSGSAATQRPSGQPANPSIPIAAKQRVGQIPKSDGMERERVLKPSAAPSQEAVIDEPPRLSPQPSTPPTQDLRVEILYEGDSVITTRVRVQRPPGAPPEKTPSGEPKRSTDRRRYEKPVIDAPVRGPNGANLKTEKQGEEEVVRTRAPAKPQPPPEKMPKSSMKARGKQLLSRLRKPGGGTRGRGGR